MAQRRCTAVDIPTVGPDAIQRYDLFLKSQELAPVGFCILRAVRDAGGTIADFEWTYANPAALRTMKASNEALIGARLLDRLPGNRSHPDLFPRYVHTVETGEPSKVEFYYAGDGIDGFFSNAVSPMGAELIGVWFDDITDRVRSEQRMRDRLNEIEALYRNAPVGLALVDPEFRFLRVNDRMAEINGLPAQAHIGKVAWDIVPSLRDSAEPLFRKVFATGKPVEADLSGETSKFPGVKRWWHERYYPVLDKSGAVTAVGAVVEEITEQKATENVLRLSAMELRHRIKNLVSVVICLANQTFQGNELDERRQDFEGRLRALDQANSVLGDENAWWSSELGALVIRIFEGKTSPDQFTVEGPEIRLAPSITMALNMTLHELATNALKYGALSSEHGHVTVTWKIEEKTGDVELQWNESGGPAVNKPGRLGFGSGLINQVLPAEGGAVSLQFNPAGVHCTLRFPTGAAAEVT
jgi:PAS domain S-box-containing protein